MIEKLKFNEHIVTYPNNFPQFAKVKYMTIIVQPRLPRVCEPQQWTKGVDKSSILNLLDIPHFGLVMK